jgi:hypothetical protein
MEEHGKEEQYFVGGNGVGRVRVLRGEHRYRKGRVEGVVGEECGEGVVGGGFYGGRVLWEEDVMGEV